MDAQTLVDNAKARFGESILQNRIRGALGDTTDADLELMKIGLSVISSIGAALAASSVGWPLPGTWPTGSTDANGDDISGTTYDAAWPFALQEAALNIFNRRTFSGYADVPEIVQQLGIAAEKFLADINAGAAILDLGDATVVLLPPPRSVAARQRDGTSNLSSLSDRTRETFLDSFRGGAWDWVP